MKVTTSVPTAVASFCSQANGQGSRSGAAGREAGGHLLGAASASAAPRRCGITPEGCVESRSKAGGLGQPWSLRATSPPPKRLHNVVP